MWRLEALSQGESADPELEKKLAKLRLEEEATEKLFGVIASLKGDSAQDFSDLLLDLARISDGEGLSEHRLRRGRDADSRGRRAEGPRTRRTSREGLRAPSRSGAASSPEYRSPRARTTRGQASSPSRALTRAAADAAREEA